ncbi:MAG: hypothetical protein IJD35_08510 [Clostridia bacterium]|nr:hypothetical protein [Clostridia bacterium]
MKNIAEIDKNFDIPLTVNKHNIQFHNSLSAPFEVYGLLYENGHFRRMPEVFSQPVSRNVHNLSRNTAGGRLRFRTDSSCVVIHAKMPHIGKMSHFALCGSAGFDLYINNEYRASCLPPFSITDGYQGVMELGSRQMREITLHFPLYSDVTELYIGLDDTAALEAPTPYQAKKKMVFYGSSITQGGCASRPGTAYPTLVARHFDSDFINLGFTGNAKGEPAMAEYIKTLPMSVFIYDYDHNAPSVEHLENTHENMFKIIREANPNLPIVMLSRPRYFPTEEEKERLAIIRQTYENALANGDKNVYFIDGKTLMQFCQNEGTVDGCHPTDLGFYSMAQTLIGLLETIL